MPRTLKTAPAGPRSRPLWPRDPRTVWRNAYSRVRARKLTGRDLWEVVTEETGARDAFDGEAGCIALRLQRGLEEARKPETPLRVQLQRRALNGWGTRNPWGWTCKLPGAPPPRPAPLPAVPRKPAGYDLRALLKARGLLDCDAGGWVQRVRSAPGITADDFVRGRPVVWTGWNGQRFAATYYSEPRGPRGRIPPGIAVVYLPDAFNSKAPRQCEPMTEAEARERFASLRDPCPLDEAAA